MEVKLIHCTGFEPAMIGAMLSYGKTSLFDFKLLADNNEIRPEIKERFEPLSNTLVSSGAGHDKFLEQIQYWVAIRAPLRFWKQFDTYRVGCSKSSESTMHLAWKGGVDSDDFEEPELIFPETLKRLNETIEQYRNEKDNTKKKELFNIITLNLPDGYLQTRMVNTNAKSLRNMYFQRKDHKLGEWNYFCDALKEFPYGDLITLEKKND